VLTFCLTHSYLDAISTQDEGTSVKDAGGGGSSTIVRYYLINGAVRTETF
jgi:hypothetical protein